jgi:hypothetical protein
VQAKNELAADGHGAQFGVEAFAILNVALVVSPPVICAEFERRFAQFKEVFCARMVIVIECV